MADKIGNPVRSNTEYYGPARDAYQLIRACDLTAFNTAFNTRCSYKYYLHRFDHFRNNLVDLFSFL